MDPSTPTSARPHRRASWLFLLPFAALLAGCGGSDAGPTAPSSPEDGAAYLPAGPLVEVVRNDWRDFQVVPPAGRELTVHWHRGDAAPQLGPRFRYFGTPLGTEDLEARIVDDLGNAWTRHWTVTVVPVGTPRVDFLPAGEAVDAYVSVDATFIASTRWPVTAASWALDGAPAGTDTLLYLAPDAEGSHRITVRIETPDTTAVHAWDVTVRPFADAAPPAVAGLALTPGDAAGRCYLWWDPVPDSVLPVTGYEVRFGYDGPPDAAGWDAAQDPGDVDWFDGSHRIKVGYTPENAGLVPDREVWFAVRARNERGQLSDVGETVHLRLPGEWWLEGDVRGPDGGPVVGVRVRDRDRLNTTATDAAGHYRVGPYFELAPVVLEAGSDADLPVGEGWHLARSGPLLATGSRRQDFLLIPRLGSAPGCFTFGSNFLKYLRTMTDTWVPTLARPNVNLYHWETYPVTVYVPAWVSGNGVDYGACAREAVRIWNTLLGEDCFTVVDDSTRARIAFKYYSPDVLAYGLAVLDQPGDGDLTLGEAVPEHATVYITDIAPTAQVCTELSLHELGHMLGLINHAYCNDVPYLMFVSAIHCLDNGWENAIHPDELRAVRMIRELPQGLDMSVYPLDVP